MYNVEMCRVRVIIFFHKNTAVFLLCIFGLHVAVKTVKVFPWALNATMAHVILPTAINNLRGTEVFT
jgi:hypothetical protein